MTDDREGEHAEWMVAAQILADYGDRAGEYIFRVTRDAKDDPRAMRRWVSIVDKIQALNGPDGLLH